MVEEKELTQLASLARINLSEAERAELLNDLRAILDYVDELKQAAPIGKGSTLKTQNLKVEPWRNNLRDDGAAHPAGEYTRGLLTVAPRTEGAYFKVKAIFGDKNKNGGS